MKEELLKLADRVEALSGPDREVDERISLAIGLPATVTIGHEVLGNLRQVPHTIKRYTASLDAAMTLCQPDENRWPQIEYIGHNPNNIKDGHRVRLWFNAKKVSGQSMVSAALALCAAALRALAKEEG